MFYNETFGVNANNLNLEFEFGGGLAKDNNVYYYIAFQSKKLEYYVKKITGYNIIFLDKNFVQTNNINKNNFLFHKSKIGNSNLGLHLYEKYIKTNNKNIKDIKDNENRDDANNIFIKKSKSCSFDKLDEYKSLSPRKKFAKTTSMIIEDDYIVI